MIRRTTWDPNSRSEDDLPPALPPLAGARLPHLRALGLTGFASQPRLVESIAAAAAQLTALALSHVDWLGVDGDGDTSGVLHDLEQLSHLTGLQELDLSGARIGTYQVRQQVWEGSLGVAVHLHTPARGAAAWRLQPGSCPMCVNRIPPAPRPRPPTLATVYQRGLAPAAAQAGHAHQSAHAQVGARRPCYNSRTTGGRWSVADVPLSCCRPPGWQIAAWRSCPRVGLTQAWR